MRANVCEFDKPGAYHCRRVGVVWLLVQDTCLSGCRGVDAAIQLSKPRVSLRGRMEPRGQIGLPPRAPAHGRRRGPTGLPLS